MVWSLTSSLLLPKEAQWANWYPFHLKPGLGPICSVTWSPILLEDKVSSAQLFPVFLKSATDQPNLRWCVQSTVNYLEASNPTGRHASPYLDFPSSVHSCGYNTVWVVPLSYSSSNNCPPPWNQLKNWLVGKQHLRPLFGCSILPLPTPLQSLLFVGLCAQRLPYCNTAFQPKLL